MDTPPRWPRTARAIVQAATVVGAVGLVWLLATATGLISVPACDDGSCGYVLSALGLVAIVFFAITAIATWAVIVGGRAVGKVARLHRYGRWLSVHERTDRSRDRHDLALEVEYHDATGGPVAGVEIVCVVVGSDATAHRLGNATAVTDALGKAEIEVRVPAAPTVVTVRASVPSNPGVKGAGGVFLVGAG